MARKPPRLTGRTLALVRAAAETPGLEAPIREIMRRGMGIDDVAKLPEEMRGELRQTSKPIRARLERKRSDAKLPLPIERPWPRTARAYAEAFERGATTPLEVAERALKAVDDLAKRSPSMNIAAFFDRERTLNDASDATERVRSKRARSPIDGVPMLIKDEFDVRGLPTTLGSRCTDLAPKDRDSTVVARLASAGAVFVAKTVLTEWGMSPIGANTQSNAPMPHNAHDAERAPGGSSTGSGVGVALGVAPLAAGGDGGGSIRIPSCLNGVFGIKPTFGRVSRAGDGFKGSVAHAGPLGASAYDLAMFLDAVAREEDPDDELTAWAEPPLHGSFASLLGAGVRGLAIGVPEAEWSEASSPVARAGKAALAALERDGARLVPIDLPRARHAAKIGYLTIGPESVASNLRALEEKRELIGDDVRLMFALLSRFTAVEQIDAQRLRTGLREEVARALAEVDVLALPTTATSAPRFSKADEARAFSDPAAIEALTRFAFLANLTGLPAGTAPVGLDGALPVGLQIVGDAWDEATVLSVLAHLERMEIAIPKRPPRAFDLLER